MIAGSAAADVGFRSLADITPVNYGVCCSTKADTALFRLGPNAFIQKTRAVLHFDLLLLHPLFALAHPQCLIDWHHLFRRSGLHAIRHLR
jgi:hypothetical protein